jgi:hypothetical protein
LQAASSAASHFYAGNGCTTFGTAALRGDAVVEDRNARAANQKRVALMTSRVRFTRHIAQPSSRVHIQIPDLPSSAVE